MYCDEQILKYHEFESLYIVNDDDIYIECVCPCISVSLLYGAMHYTVRGNTCEYNALKYATQDTVHVYNCSQCFVVVAVVAFVFGSVRYSLTFCVNTSA